MASKNNNDHYQYFEVLVCYKTLRSSFPYLKHDYIQILRNDEKWVEQFDTTLNKLIFIVLNSDSFRHVKVRKRGLECNFETCMEG